MIKFFKNFRKDESGAVTVDWVVLTAAVCALAGVVYSAIKTNSDALAAETGSYIAASGPGTAGVSGPATE